MREILFRGKRIDNGEWVEGYLYITHNGEYEIGHYDAEVNIERLTYVVDPSTVGQYTGLTDKNGKRIFEGDVLEHHAQGDIIVNRGVVNWDEKNARWAHQLNTMNPCFYMHNPKAVEVIGNIHDNPELLKEDDRWDSTSIIPRQ